MSEYSNSKYPIENPNIVKVDKVKENECKMVRSGRMVLLLPIVYVQFAISLWEYVSRGREGGKGTTFGPINQEARNVYE